MRSPLRSVLAASTLAFLLLATAIAPGTAFAQAAAPVIGVAKSASGNGTQFTIDLHLENFGAEAIQDLALFENLDAVFGANNYAIVSPPFFVDDPGTLVLNGSFNGSSDPNLLAAGSTLSDFDTAQLRFVVNVTTVVDVGNGLGIYSNQVTFSGENTAGTAASDLSDSGEDPDPNGNGDPTEDGEDDPTLLIIGEAPSPLTFLVTKLADTNDGTCDADCSLREALAAADANAATEADRIEFAPSVTGTITLGGSELVIASDVVVDGPGAQVLAVDGGSQSNRVFNIANPGGAVHLSGLTITRGRSVGNAGGVFVGPNSTLTLSESVVSDNVANFGGAGGGLYVEGGGALNLIRSLVSGNRSTINGGGLYNNGGTVVISASTISSNTRSTSNSSDVGAGIYQASGSTTLNNTTVTGNRPSNNGEGLGIHGFVNAGGTATLNNSIIGGNDGTDTDGAFVSNGSNVIGTPGTASGLASDVIANPLLGPLADNGGPTLTHALLPGSPAIDIGGTCGPTDQRGFDAPTDGDGTDGQACDAGAVERATFVACTETLFTDAVDTDANTLTLSFSNPDGLAQLTFDALTNLSVVNSDGWTSSDGSTWTAATSGDTEVTFVLQQVDPGNEEASYSVTVSSVCANELDGTLEASFDDAFLFAPTGALELQLVVEPVGGSFDLIIDGQILTTGGSGITTGEQTVVAGDRIVRIGGDGGTNSNNYTTTFACRDSDGTGDLVAEETVTGTTTVTVPVGDGEDVVCIVTARLQGSIEGQVFNDLDGDGVFDFGVESGLADVTVFVDLNTNGSAEGDEPATTSASNGFYQFLDVVAGTYQVRVDVATVPPGFAPTTANPLGVDVAAGEDVANVFFGFQEQEVMTFVVNTLADEDDGVCGLDGADPLQDCSLREALALADANPAPEPDTVRFAADVLGGTIALASSFGQLTLASDVVIDAEAGATPGASGVTIDAGMQGFRVMEVNSDVAVTLLGLTITGGQNARGGGIFNAGDLTLRRSTLTGNAGESGGGIRSEGPSLVVEQSTISNNTALTGTGQAAGLYVSNGSLVVRSSTISNNTAINGGSGMLINTSQPALIENTTITGNTTNTLRTIQVVTAAVTLSNTIVAGNTGGDFDCGAVLGGSFTSLGHNVVEPGRGCPSDGTGDVTVAPADVFTTVLDESLAANGGPTHTHALLPGSPAIDIGGTCGPTDQRGFEAPIVGDPSNSTALCDAGSLETEILDATPPTVTIATTATNPTATEPIPVTFAVSEDVTGFEADDVTVTGGTLENFTTAGADIAPDGSGEVTVFIAAGRFTDLAGNPNEASNTLSVTFDADGPAGYTAAFDQGAVNAANETAVSFTISDAEVGATFAYTITSDGGAGEVTGSGTIGGAAPRTPAAMRMSGNKGGSADLPTLAVATLTSEQVTGLDVSSLPDGTLTLSVTLTDPLGNAGDAVTDTVLKDTVAPTVVVSTTAPDPTNTEPIPVTFTFSEDVTGLSVSDVTVTGGTLGALSTSDNVTFTGDVTPDGSGEVTVAVVADQTSDLAGNGNAASNTLAITFDGDVPTVVVSTTAPDPTNTEPIPVTFTFSEEVTGFEAGDVTVTGGTLGTLATDDNTTFTGDVTPDGSGEVTVTVAAGVAEDTAGNGNEASNTLTITFDGDVPVLTIATTTPEPTVQSPFPVTFSFSEAVTGFTEDDIDVTNGALSDFAGSGDTYTAQVTPAAFGEVVVSVDAGVATDAAGNGNTADALTRTYEERFDLTLTTDFVFDGPGTGTLTAIVTNTGSVPATRARVKITRSIDVATGPKQIVVGALAPGETGTAVFDFGSAGENAEVRLKVEDLVVRNGEPDRSNNNAVVLLVPGDGGEDVTPPEITGTLSGQVFAGTAEENRINDTGVASLVLDGGAVNLTLAVDPFTPGATVVSYTATPIDPMLDASGTLRATDVEGNASTLPVSIPRTPPPPPTETLVVRLTPDNAPIFIGVGGGSFTFTGEVTNPTDGRLTQEVWLVLISPSGAEEVQFGPFRVRLDAGGMTSEMFTVTVDREAEAGVYTYEGRVGTFPGTVTDRDSFTFEKLGDGSREAEPLALGGLTDGVTDGASTNARVVLPTLSTTAGLVWGITDDAEWAALEAADDAAEGDAERRDQDGAETDAVTDADDLATTDDTNGRRGADDAGNDDAVTDGATTDNAVPDDAATETTTSADATRGRPDHTGPEDDAAEDETAEDETAEDEAAESASEVDRKRGTRGKSAATPAKDDAMPADDATRNEADEAVADTQAAPVAASTASLPETVTLHAAYPNPFTRSATLTVDLPTATHLTVTVYDLLGRTVATLADGTTEAGSHALTLDAASLSAGVYVVRMTTAEGEAQTQRVTLVR